MILGVAQFIQSQVYQVMHGRCTSNLQGGREQMGGREGGEEGERERGEREGERERGGEMRKEK